MTITALSVVAIVAVDAITSQGASAFTPSISNANSIHIVKPGFSPPRQSNKLKLHYSTYSTTNNNNNNNNLIDIHEDSPRDTSNLQPWATSYGIQTDPESFSLTATDIDGYLDISAVTMTDIPAGSTIMYIPNEIMLSSYSAMEEFGSLLHDVVERRLISSNNNNNNNNNNYDGNDHVFDNDNNNNNDHSGNNVRHYYLMIKLLTEYEKGPQSPWYHYLNSLPRMFFNGPSMTPFCYRCIPSFLSTLCQKERANFNTLMIKNIPDGILHDPSIRSNDDLWEWVYQIVHTRSIEGPNGDLVIVPMYDMINHGGEGNVQMEYDEYGNGYVQSTKDILAGSPLCITYGDVYNPSYLLARYGFLEDRAPASFCKLIPNHVSEEMINLGYSPNRMLFYHETGDISEEVWDILLYMVLGDTCEDGGMTQQQFYQAHMNGDYDTKSRMHEEWYVHTLARLAEHVEEVLRELESLEEKAVYGGRVAGDDHPRLPLILRHNAFVKETFLAVKNRYFAEE